MRFNEIAPPASHPYIVEQTIDPADLRRLQRLVAESPELRIVDLDDSTPDYWRVRVGCASRTVQDNFDSNWE